MRLKGKKAIVTGANRSMGQAIAIALAKEGADVVISYRSDEQGAGKTVAAIEKTGRLGKCFYADFSDPQAADKFVEQAISTLGGIDILINNAAMLAREILFEITPELFSKVMQVNTLSPFRLTQLCTKHMLDNNVQGSVVNISSISATRTAMRGAVYSASKAAVNKLTQNNAKELAAHGIRVNAILPGVIKAGMNEDTAKKDAVLWAEYLAGIPMVRTGTADDVCKAVLFFASDDASWITGKILEVDGGEVM